MSMSMTPRTEGIFRAETAGRTPVPGEWKCRVCREWISKFRTEGRKRHLSGIGWTCGECVKERIKTNHEKKGK